MMKTLFDAAWDLVKAPLDYDSIKDVSIPGKGKRSMAYFDDPITGKRYPMVNFGGSQIMVYDPEYFGDDANGFNPWDPNATAYNIGDADYELAVNRDGESLGIRVNELGVDEAYQRRGIATAMHDLFAENIAPRRFTHGNPLSEAGWALWNKIYEMQAEEVPEGHPDYGKKSKERWNQKTGTPYWPLREEKT